MGSDDEASSGRFRSIHLWPLAFYVVVGFLFLMPLPLRGRTEVVQTSSDVRQHLWWLWWTNEALQEGRSPYFTDRLFHPTGVHLYLSPMDNVAGLLAIPLQRAFGLVSAYNLLVLAGNVFSAYAMFLLALEVTRSSSGALVAGAAFAFAPLLSAATNRGQLEWANVGFMPLAVLGLVRLQQGPIWAVIPRAVFFSLAMLVTWYQGLFVALFAGIFWLWRIVDHALLHEWKRIGSFSLRLCLWGLVSLVLVAPLLLPTLRAGAANRAAAAPPEWVALNAATPLAPLFPFNAASGPDRPLWSHALGFVLLVLPLLGAFSARRRAAFWVSCYGAFYLLALGPIVTLGDHRIDSPLLPYNLLYALPFGLGRIPRTAVRFLIMASVCASILTAWGVARLQLVRSVRGPRPHAVTALALLLVLGAVCPIPRPLQSARLHPFYGWLAEAPPGAVLELPRQRISDAMYGQTAHGKPLLGGYVSRHTPEDLRNYETPVIRQLWTLTLPELTAPDAIDQAPLQSCVPEVLDAYGLRYVVVHLDAETSAGLDSVLREVLPESSVVWSDGALRAYRVPSYPDRKGVVVGFGLGWTAPLQRPSTGQWYRWAGAQGRVILLLLDHDSREMTFRARARVRRRTPIEVDLDSAPVATLSLGREERDISLPVRLQPGYNALRFHAQGKTIGEGPSADEDPWLVLGQVRVDPGSLPMLQSRP